MITLMLMGTGEMQESKQAIQMEHVKIGKKHIHLD